MTDKHFERMEQAVLEAFGEPPKPSVRAAHLRAMTAEIPAVYVARSRRRRLVMRGGAVALGLALAGGSAMAATGTLPDPVQNAVADALDGVVDLPGGTAAGGEPKHPVAAANKDEADAFTQAMKDYNACRKAEREAAESLDPSATPATSECGERPERQDFEAGPASDEPAEPERTSKGVGGGPPEDRPEPPRTPNPASQEKGPPEDLEPGPPEGAGKPSSLPSPRGGPPSTD